MAPRRVLAALALALLPAVASGLPAAGLPDTSGYVNDGYNSDVALQLYINYRGSPTAKAKTVTLASLPADVQARLDAAGVSDFAILDGRVQRALLWDSGYTVDPLNRPRRLYTKDGRSVANLTVSLAEYAAVECSMFNCSQPNGMLAYNNEGCNGDQMLSASKCATETFSENPEVHAPMWATGGDPDGAPMINLFKHAWLNENDNVSYVVYAVHTTEGEEPGWGECVPKGTYESYVVPCIGMNQLTDANRASFTAPTPSDWVDAWLLEFADTDPKTASGGGSFNLLYLIPIIAGVLLIVAIVVVVARRRRNQAAQQAHMMHESTIDPNAMVVATPGGDSTADYTKPTDGDSVRPTLTANNTATSNTQYGSSAYGSDSSESGSNSILRALCSDPNLVGKRFPLEQITMVKALSKGAFGEVWLGELRGEQVAVKRLLQTKQPSFSEFQEFTSEIQLSASLVHPNIIGFLGVAWSSINTLVMVLEFLPGGDLQSLLQRQGDLMSWARDKIHVAVGLARALQYLHARDPPLIHRDLKSKNVLLTRAFEPKLIDFGVSREQKDDMTAGVGTPYWTAPEVLEGTRYSTQSDIFSFGVLLSELDTCKTPYWDAVHAESGAPLKPFQILKEVMAGSLRPSFTSDCPDRIRRVADACLLRNPSDRPSAEQLVDMLGG